MTMTVRPEEPDDRDASLEVERAAFGTTNEIAEEDFQIAVLDAARVRPMSGVVRWHPAFG